MNQFRIALIQKTPLNNQPHDNLKVGKEYCVQAKNLNAEIVLFPEMWSTGYWNPLSGKSVNKNDLNNIYSRLYPLSIKTDSHLIKEYQELASSLNMAIGLTYLEKHEHHLRNSLCLIVRHGYIALHYSKIHTCDFGFESVFTSGQEFTTTTLDTKQGGINIGAMICYDREFPESARVLMLKGAEIILTPNACVMNRIRIEQLKARAFENMVGIALANYPAPTYNGHSMVIDGMAFNPDESERDMIIALGNEAEKIITAGFDIGEMRNYRNRESWGNKYRKQDRYRIITE